MLLWSVILEKYETKIWIIIISEQRGICHFNFVGPYDSRD